MQLISKKVKKKGKALPTLNADNRVAYPQDNIFFIYMETTKNGIPRYVIFSTQQYRDLAKTLLKTNPSGAGASSNFEWGSLETKKFADGEHYCRIVSSISHRDVVLIGGTVSDEDTLELYDLASGLVDAGAHRLMVMIPYFGYSTMERAVKSGEIVKAKTRARLLSSIPVPGSGAKVILLDLHVDSIAHYFEGNIRPWHLSGRPVILKVVKETLQLDDANDIVMASTDAGRAKIVESLANDLHVPASFVFKRRMDSGATSVTAVSAQVSGKHVIIYDDSECIPMQCAHFPFVAPNRLLAHLIPPIPTLCHLCSFYSDSDRWLTYRSSPSI